MSEVWIYSSSFCWESLLSGIVSEVWKSDVKVGKYSMGCKHSWEFIDKWSDGKYTYWEFYCKFCLDIRIVDNKRGFKLKEDG